MPNDPSRELSLYFHIDPQLARNRDCFHFHVLLDGSPAPASKQKSALELTTEPTVQFCVPPNGNQNQDVRTVSGATTGTICSIGRATSDGEHPSEVRGKVYLAGDGLSAPATPPTDASVKTAQLVNCPSHPAFTTTLCGTTIVPNFVFNDQFSNEIPGAQCSTTGVANDLVIWMRFAGVWHKSAPQLFTGICAATTECGDSSGTEGVPAVMMLLAGPKKLRVVSPGPSPKAGSEFTLHRVGAETGSIVTWQSCPQANPECTWKMWLKSNAGVPFATLALLAVDGKRLQVPLVWKCLDWHPEGESRFTYSSPSGSKQERTVARVVPV